jgi:hypothetical protein
MHSGDCFSDPDAVAAAVGAISGHGPARELWGYGMDNLVGLGRVRGPMPFSIPQVPRRIAGDPTSASFFGASLVKGLVAMTSISESPKTKNSCSEPHCCESRSRSGGCFATSTPPESEPIGPERCLQRSASHVGYAWSLSIRWPTSVARIPEVLGVYLSGVGYVFGLIQSRRSESPRG